MIIDIPEDIDCWLTSDLHFSHPKIVQYEPEVRGVFKDWFHMNQVMIERWNSKIKEGDMVINGGDTFLGNAESWPRVVSRLNSWNNVYAVKGNHDKEKSFYLYKNGLPKDRYFRYKGYVFWLNHFYVDFVDWRKREGYERSVAEEPYDFALSGHSHSKLGINPMGKSVSICADMNNLYPFHIEEVLENCKKWLK